VKLNYGIWEGNPCVSKRFEDGPVMAQLWDGNRWFAIHPADFAIEATHLEETEYKAMFPAVPAPIFPAGE
jgi:hypothetical protein